MVQNKVTRQERGWAGHFIAAQSCRFRRNTLLTCGDIRIVISTVGAMESHLKDRTFETIGYNRYFETMAFHACPTDTRYYDIDVTKEISFESEWAINEIDADDKANDMHETVVDEITNRLAKGEKFKVNEEAY